MSSLMKANFIISTTFSKTGQILFFRFSQKSTVMHAKKVFTLKAHKTQQINPISHNIISDL